MKSVYFNSEVTAAEKKIIANTGIPSLILMENAGGNSAKLIKEIFIKEKYRRIYILTGKGNNAGDGFVIARHLVNQDISVTVLMLYNESELKGDALINYNVIKNLDSSLKLNILQCDNVNSLKKSVILEDAIIVDAVFGIGFKGELEPGISNIFRYINKSNTNKKVIAVDTISGLADFRNASGCLKADITISMGIKKFNSMFDEGREFSGKNITVDIGIHAKEFDYYNDKKIYEIETKDLRRTLIKRNINSNKYTNGKVFILAGSKGFTGAAYLASLSALRSGSGAVILGIPESLNIAMESKTTEIITYPLPETEEGTISEKAYDKIIEKMKWSDVTLIGPGIGRNEETLELVRNVVKKSDRNIVIDADGIFAFRKYNSVLKKKDTGIIITPHYGEFSNLTGISLDEMKNNFYTISKEFAKKNNLIIILKNSPSVITDGIFFIINSSGRENLATVGSGDVLSGIVASIYSHNFDPFTSAIAGTYIHGKCGDIIYNKSGDSSTIASDLIDLIPEVKNEYLY